MKQAANNELPRLQFILSRLPGALMSPKTGVYLYSISAIDIS